MRVQYILDGDESRGNPQTLSLCLTWIPVRSDMNRCPKDLSIKVQTLINSLTVIHAMWSNALNIQSRWS